MQDNEGGGALPLEGSIPDMTATTDAYLRIQRVYRAEAERACAAVHVRCVALLESLGRDTAEVSAEDVRLMCKNARNVRVARFRPLADELTPGTCKVAELKQARLLRSQLGFTCEQPGTCKVAELKQARLLLCSPSVGIHL